MGARRGSPWNQSVAGVRGLAMGVSVLELPAAKVWRVPIRWSATFFTKLLHSVSALTTI